MREIKIMIKEDYVSFETAKLLKEKGFDEKVDTFYKTDAEFLKSTLCINYNDANFTLLDIHNIPENTVSAPTIQMAMKWLRKKYDLHCDIDYDDLDWCWDILSISEMVPVAERPEVIKNGNDGYESYEEACEAAIQYCLQNLI